MLVKEESGMVYHSSRLHQAASLMFHVEHTFGSLYDLMIYIVVLKSNNYKSATFK